MRVRRHPRKLFPNLTFDTYPLHPLTTTRRRPAVRVTTEAIIGCILVLTGAGIRLASQRSLGSFFTWEKAVKKDQELITTGPYAVVRHPSYTGMILVTAGTLLCHFGPGAWLRQSSLLEFWWRKVLWWCGWAIRWLFRVFCCSARLMRIGC
ncbi:hypothetical protein BC629DRAFT_746110 [Irpex lacteus]|nr:hypothetical protein BC629DRAFT_746110 [Irpex lacteus]